MDVFLEHISINVSDTKISFPFYRELFKYFGYEIIKDNESRLAARKCGTPDFWIKPTEKKYISNKFHRKNTGLNHLAFHVSSKEEVNKFYNEFLRARNIRTLYDSPKAFLDYEPDYYAVFFEDPDRIKLEVCFISKDRIYKVNDQKRK